MKKALLIIALILLAGCMGSTPTASPLVDDNGVVIAAPPRDESIPIDIGSLNGISTGIIIAGIIGFAQALVNTDEKQPIKGRATIYLAVGVGLVLYTLAAATKYDLANASPQMRIAVVIEIIMSTIAVPGLVYVTKEKLLPAVGRTKLLPIKQYVSGVGLPKPGKLDV